MFPDCATVETSNIDSSNMEDVHSTNTNNDSCISHGGGGGGGGGGEVESIDGGGGDDSLMCESSYIGGGCDVSGGGGDRRMLFVRRDVEDYLSNNFSAMYDSVSELIVVQNEASSCLSVDQLLHRVNYSALTCLCIVDCTLDFKQDDSDCFQVILYTTIKAHCCSHTMGSSPYLLD